MKLKLTIILLTLHSALMAQNGMEPMWCEGPIPKELKQSITDILANRDNSDFKTKNLLGIYDIFASGMVVYGNSSWQTVDRIGRSIISKNHIDTNVHFFLLRSSAYNAFATDEGYIFATTALLANVKTEDELAFVLCHELSHYILGHNLKTQELKKTKIKELRKKMKASRGRNAKLKTLDNFLKEYYSFSRANELEADSLGMLFYLKSGYNPNSIVQSLNNLQYAQPIFHSETFHPETIEPGFSASSLTKPIALCTYKALFKQKDVMFRYEEPDEDDEKSEEYKTHPDWNIRVERAKDILKSHAYPSVQPTPIQATVMQQSLTELLLTEYKSGHYFYALSYLLVLEKHFPETKDLAKMKGICLSSIYLQSKTGQKMTVSSDYMDSTSMLSKLFFHLIAFEKNRIRNLALYYNNLETGSGNIDKMCGHYTAKILKTNDTLSAMNVEDKAIILYCEKDKSDTLRLMHPFVGKIKPVLDLLEAEQNDFKIYSLNTEAQTVKNSTGTYPQKWRTDQRDSLILLSPNFIAVPSRQTKAYRDPLMKNRQKHFMQSELMRYGSNNNIYYNNISFDNKENLSTEQYNQYFLIMEMIDEYVESGGDSYKCPLSILYTDKIIAQTGCKKVQLVQMVYENHMPVAPVTAIADAYLTLFTYFSTFDFPGYFRSLFTTTTVVNVIFDLENSSIEFVSFNYTGMRPDRGAVSTASQKVISDTKEYLIKK